MRTRLPAGRGVIATLFALFLAACGTLFSWSFGTLSFLNASRRIDPGLLNRIVGPQRG